MNHPHSPVITCYQGAFGCRKGNVILAGGVLTVDEKWTGDPNWDLRCANKVLDVPAGGLRIKAKGSHVLKFGPSVLGEKLPATLGSMSAVVILTIAWDGKSTHVHCSLCDRALTLSCDVLLNMRAGTSPPIKIHG